MSTASGILAFSEKLSLYFTFTIFFVGCIGNLIDLGVLTTLKLFRSNQCAFFLIVESTVNTCQLSILCIINLLPIILGYESGNTSLVWCKLRSSLPQILRLISTSMVCLASLDQFLSTNPQVIIRQMSSLKLARHLTISAIVLWIAHTIPYAIFYQIVPPRGCINTSVTLITYYSFFYYPILHGFLPIIVSSLFALLAYRNVRRLVRRQVGAERRRLDRQLTAMIFIRVICYILFLSPYTIYRIYALNATVSSADSYPYAIDRLMFAITSSLSNLNYAMNFYIFLTSSSRYRRQVKHFLVKKCWRSVRTICNVDQNEVHPSGGISTVAGTESE